MNKEQKPHVGDDISNLSKWFGYIHNFEGLRGTVKWFLRYANTVGRIMAPITGIYEYVKVHGERELGL